MTECEECSRDTLTPPENTDPKSLSQGGFAPEVLAAAVHFVGTNDSFDKALEASIKFAGPANYCPVLVGSIGGARWGESEIREPLLKHCSSLPRVRDVANSLAADWQTPVP